MTIFSLLEGFFSLYLMESPRLTNQQVLNGQSTEVPCSVLDIDLNFTLEVGKCTRTWVQAYIVHNNWKCKAGW